MAAHSKMLVMTRGSFRGQGRLVRLGRYAGLFAGMATRRMMEASACRATLELNMVWSSRVRDSSKAKTYRGLLPSRGSCK